MRQFTVTYSMLYKFSARLHKDIDNLILFWLFVFKFIIEVFGFYYYKQRN